MYCECGCGQLTNFHRGQYRRFIQGHSILKPSPRYKGIDKLVELHQGKHLCACGCGGYIKTIPHHFYGKTPRGIPKYIHGHYTNTPERKAMTREMSSKRVGNLSPRWKENRDEVRGRIRCKVDFTRRQKRDIYLRDKGICQHCEIICLLDVDIDHPYKVNIDHIIAVEDGGINEIINGQVLCLSCHKFKHSAKAKVANSVKPKAKAMAIPSQAPNRDACVETNGQPTKVMI